MKPVTTFKVPVPKRGYPGPETSLGTGGPSGAALEP
jgi:hypothetical protein